MFNKKAFKELLMKALGDRTMTDYAKESGVNRTYISKYMNENLDNAPTPDIIKRLANTAYNDVTYEELMKAAGHLDNSSIYNNIEYQLEPKENEDIETVVDELKIKLLNTKNLKFDGKLATKDDIEAILDAVKVGIEMAKMKKHRNKKDSQA